MIIKEIKLTNFRNYKQENVSFDASSNIVTGKNGQGKTNLLEAIYIMSLGKSFRTLRDDEMINFEEDFFQIKGIFNKDGEDITIEIRESKRDKVFIIGGVEKRRYADLVGQIHTVIFSPEDLKIVKEDPKKRRNFIDRELFFLKPLYYLELVKYKKALRNRNAILKSNDLNKNLLIVYENQLSESGANIMHYRAEFIKKLDEAARETEKKITGGTENLTVNYDSNVEFTEDKEEQKLFIASALNSSREKDIRNRTTTTGPHKDDLRICANNIDLRRYGSQGQHRTAALSLKLAELNLIKEETGHDPILLLDDVLSELDKDRQTSIINIFKGNQLFISAAEISGNVLEKMPQGKIITINNGKVE